MVGSFYQIHLILYYTQFSLRLCITCGESQVLLHHIRSILLLYYSCHPYLLILLSGPPLVLLRYQHLHALPYPITCFISFIDVPPPDSITQHSLAWLTIALHDTTSHRIAQHSLTLHRMAQHSLALHNLAQHLLSCSGFVTYLLYTYGLKICYPPAPSRKVLKDAYYLHISLITTWV